MFAGPVANLILPVLVFAVTLAVGMPRRDRGRSAASSRASPAAAAGLRPGDKITCDRGRAGRVVERPRGRDRARAGGETWRSPTSAAACRATASSRSRAARSVDEFGKPIEVGWAGLEHHRPAAMLGIPSTESPAHAAGLRSGDVVESVNGMPVESWEEFAAAYAAVPRGEVQLALRRSEPIAPGAPRRADPADAPASRRTVTVPALGSVEALGVLPATVLVSTVEPGSAAEQGGLRPGDLIVSVDGAPVGSFGSFAEIVRTSGGRPLAARVRARRRAPLGRDRARGSRTTTRPASASRSRATSSASPREVASLPGAEETDRERNPLVALPRAVAMTVEVTRSFIAGLGEARDRRGVAQAARRVRSGSPRSRATPIERGWETYLSILVLISINLGDPEPAADPGARRRPGA